LRYEAPLSAERRSQGWSDTEFVGVDVAQIATGEIPCSGTDQVNIFTGFLTHPDVWGAFKRIPSGAPGLCLAYAEAPEIRGVSGWGTQIKYRLAACRLRKRLRGVLALGELGADFYRGLLNDRVPVTTFGYYDRLASWEKPATGDLKPETTDLEPESSETSGLSSYNLQVSSLSSQVSADSAPSGLRSQVSGLGSEPSGPSTEPSLSTYVAPVPPHPAPMLGKIGALQPSTRRLLFVGQCIWREGLDQLLVALASMPPSTPGWVLDVVGVGTESYVFMQLAERLDLVDRVRFRGVMRGKDLERLYEKANLVVVPSRWDGWGMSVNEALFAGVPVAATTACGAMSVIENLQRCLVLPSDKTKAWPELLSEWLEWGPASEGERNSLKAASLRLTGEAGAEELRKVIEKLRSQ
jgi:glycosyltransferase involved in cell wall biosynthesis